MPEGKPAAPKFDAMEFTLAKPLATPKELAVAFGMLIESICDLTGQSVQRVITPGLSAITISWKLGTVPSEEWLREVEIQLEGFAACNGVQVHFRQH
jgi:hypothetical protein